MTGLINVMIAFLIGLFIFIIPVELPEFLKKTIGYLASLNSPLAMILLGYFLSKEPIIYYLIDYFIKNTNLITN